MKILVTGGAGYVGSVLVGMLARGKYDVRILDRMDHGVQPLFGVAHDPLMEIVQGDVNDVDTVAKALDGVDIIIHLAALVGYPACAADPEEAEHTNIGGMHKILGLMNKHQKLIFASTGSVYGKVQGTADETLPPAPLSLYGKQKVQCESMIRNCGVKYVILRFATLFGLSPRMRLDLLVNDFVYQAVHNRQIILYEGHFRRSFLHVVDACMAYRLIIEKWTGVCPYLVENSTFNVGSADMGFSKWEIAEQIREKVDFYLHEAGIGTDADQRDYDVDYGKIYALGFRRGKSMDESIDRMIRVLAMLKEPSPLRNA
jgi:nucleoside-diphosphate-sugar epimerase